MADKFKYVFNASVIHRRVDGKGKKTYVEDSEVPEELLKDAKLKPYIKKVLDTTPDKEDAKAEDAKDTAEDAKKGNKKK